MIGIVAVNSRGVIGDKGGIPWSVRADLGMFRSLTLNSTIIMGRRTWESLPEARRPLAGRFSLVVTSSPLTAERRQTSCEAVRMEDLDDRLLSEPCAGSQAFVIGGASLFDALMERISMFFVTRIDDDSDGDVRMPHSFRERFELTDVSYRFSPAATFEIFRRRKDPEF